MGIYEKLSAIQQELKAPKGQYNSFGKYKYRSCEDILEAVKPICAKHKTALVLLDDIKEVSGRFYVMAQAQLHDCESDGAVTASAFAREPGDKKGMDDSQVTGTASSYARKYALNGLFCIDDTKDADTDEARRQEEAEKEKACQDEPQTPAIPQEASHIMCQRCGRDIYPTKKKNGEIWAVSDIAKYSLKRFKKEMCPDCMKLTLAEEDANAAG